MMYKKMVSVILTLAILSLSVVPAFAVTHENSVKSSASEKELLSEYFAGAGYSQCLEQKVKDDLLVLGERGFRDFEKEIYDIQEDGTIIYAIQMLDDVIDYVDITEEIDGTIRLHFVEGNLENVVAFEANGKILLDGHRITISQEQIVCNALQPTGDAEIQAGVYRSYQKSVPKNTSADDYNEDGVLYQSTSTIDFDAELVTLSIGAIVSLLTSGLSSFTCAVTGMVTSAALNRVANWLKNTNPYYKYASFKDIKCSRPGDSVVYHYRHDVYIWNERNYGGARTLLESYYEIVEPT